MAAAWIILARYADRKEMTMSELTTLAGAGSGTVLNCDEVLAEPFDE